MKEFKEGAKIILEMAFHILTVGLFINVEKLKKDRKEYEEKLKDLEKNTNCPTKKQSEYLKALHNLFKCSECKKQATVISSDLKYCNTCGFSFSNKLHEV